MKRLIVICSALMLSIGPTVAPAGAQDSVTADSILQALKPKAKTRSILQPDDGGMTKEDAKFIDGLRSTTRQIVVDVYTTSPHRGVIYGYYVCHDSPPDWFSKLAWQKP